MKSHAQAVVIGGGVTGCSILYHLARAGWSDVMLLERSELTAGSTWHAAGGTGAFADNANMGYLHRYSYELYPVLEAETGVSCGFHPVGGVLLARTEERHDELRIHRAKARRLGLESDWLGPREALERVPVLSLDGVKAVLWDSARGHVDPSGVTQAFAHGARDHGADIHRQCPVLETRASPAGGWEVLTPEGTVHTEHVVNAAGLWAREVAALAGIVLPLMPVEHHYFVTESIPEIASLGREVPMISDADANFYMRQEGHGLLLGCYESPCTHWAVDGTPLDFGHELLPDDLARIERNLTDAIACVPVLARAGVRRVVNGPMIFSPDLSPLIGPYPGRPGYWCACGVMTAFSQAGAIGRVLADWIVEGEPRLDLFAWDVTRYGDWANQTYTRARTGDLYSTRFKTFYPYEERAAGRPVRTAPAYREHAAAGAVFGASDGWEYPLWYAPPGTPARDELSFRRPNWFAAVGEECRALHQAVGVLDISTYGKHAVTGPGARAWLERVMANRMPETDGRMVLSPMLSHAGKLMGDYTVSRLGPAEYFLVGAGTADRFHHRWWQQWLPAHGVEVRSLTAGLCGFAIAGPHARQLLQRLVDADLSASAWPYLHARRVMFAPAIDAPAGEAAGVEAIVLRISYTGELGYECYCAPAQQRALLAAMRAAGADLGVRLVGMRALGSLRLEKAYASFGREISLDYSPFEAGLERFVKLDKPDFIGRAAALRIAAEEPARRLRLLELDAGDADAWGGEPVCAGGEVVGYVTSAGYGHRVGKSLALAYLDDHAATEDLAVEVLGEPRAARCLSPPPFDPLGERMRG